MKANVYIVCYVRRSALTAAFLLSAANVLPLTWNTVKAAAFVHISANLVQLR